MERGILGLRMEKADQCVVDLADLAEQEWMKRIERFKCGSSGSNGSKYIIEW